MDRVKGILNRVAEWWKNFSTKQRMVIISILAVVLLALGILAYVLSRPTMVTLITCDSSSQASQVKDLLEGESISYQVESDNLTFTVNQSDEATASMLLGSNSIPADGYSIDNVFDGGFSSTESDKTKKYQLYMEQKLAEQLETVSNIESAEVSLSIPEDDGTIIASNQETYASIILSLDGDMDEDQAAGIAQFVATAVGNDTADSILIMDSASNVLYSGGDSSTSIGTASSQLSYKTKAENLIKSDVKDVMLGSDVYDNVEIGMNLVVNFDQTNTTTHKYSAQDGRTEGLIDQESNYESSSTGGSAATPGTDSNDDTTYVTDDGTASTSDITDSTIDHVLDEEVTSVTGAVGDISYDDSSITLVATSYHIYNEDALTADGTLANMTFDEFVAANSDRVKMDVDQDLYTAVANATGISTDNITIMAYEVPFFQYSDGSGRTWTDYLPIALAVLIFALLGFVVFRSTRREEVAELEPELSVENLLEATKEAHEDLDDIGFNDKSETRVLIEKFVDENPEAVASLLRNWLNEEWE